MALSKVAYAAQLTRLEDAHAKGVRAAMRMGVALYRLSEPQLAALHPPVDEALLLELEQLIEDHEHWLAKAQLQLRASS